jgi:xanthine/CO dehydrogenase XdhC/CoxF family maturation factor
MVSTQYPNTSANNSLAPPICSPQGQLQIAWSIFNPGGEVEKTTSHGQIFGDVRKRSQGVSLKAMGRYLVSNVLQSEGWLLIRFCLGPSEFSFDLIRRSFRTNLLSLLALLNHRVSFFGVTEISPHEL